MQAFNIDTKEKNITYNQIKLEKYIFKSKNNLTDLNEEFENLLNNSQLNRENRINKINILIDKYMAIKEYKRIEDPNLLYSLVKYKVDSYEIDYNTYGEILSGTANYLEEKEILKEIFFKKVNDFFQSSNIYQKYKAFNKFINPFTFSKIANTIKTSLKNELDIFDYNYITNNPLLTGLIYSINSPIKLCNFFSEFTVLEEDYSTITGICELAITWHNKFSLESLIRLREFIVLQNTLIAKIPRIPYHAPLLYEKLLCDLNQLYKELIDKNFITKKEQNELYEGIKTINFNCDKKIYNLMIINYIFEIIMSM